MRDEVELDCVGEFSKTDEKVRSGPKNGCMTFACQCNRVLRV